MKTKIVGIYGKARHGKNLLARNIQEALLQNSDAQIQVGIYSFAAALKSFCRAIGWMTEKDPKVLQMVGTDLMRRVNENVWVDCLRHHIVEEEPDVALISDMRFPNEVDFCKQNGLTIKIVRLNSDGSMWIADDRPADHPSEIALDSYDNFDFSFRVVSGNQLALARAARIAAQKIEELF